MALPKSSPLTIDPGPFLRRALERQLGRSMACGSAQFAWGGAWANFDRKGFMASAGLGYEVDRKGST